MSDYSEKRRITPERITFAAMMAAMVYVVTLFRFPLLGSKVHFANAVCLLSGMLLGPVTGGVAAGLGSAIYDAFAGYDVINVAITFVSKFAMAFVCGRIVSRWGGGEDSFDKKPFHRVDRTLIACAAGALTYVALYMLKTFIFQKFVGGTDLSTALNVMYTKLPASLINAAAAVVAAPIFYHAVGPVLRSTGLLKKMREG